MIDQKSLDFISEHEKEDVRKLALQAGRYPYVDMSFVVCQIAGRQIAKDKIPTWYKHSHIVYPKHISLEQCSSEKTAKYKASLCSGKSFVDLTGGLGVDFYFMSQQFEQATYVEKQAELCDLAKHNFETLLLKNTSVVNDDAETYLSEMEAVDTIYIDPARRSNSGRKTVMIEDCTPNLKEIESVMDDKGNKYIVKLSPMLDISAAVKSLNKISEVHIISVNNECKELLFVKSKPTDATILKCINIANGRIEEYSFFTTDEETSYPVLTSEVKEYLYEPNASVLKGGAYKKIAIDFNLHKLHTSSHLYTSDNIEPDFPGRKFRVKEWFPFNKKALKEHLKGVDKANITIRNFPLSVDEIRKKTSIKDGGELYIFATTLSDEKKVLIIGEKI